MLCSFQSTKVHRQRLCLKPHPVAQNTKNFEGKNSSWSAKNGIPSKLNNEIHVSTPDNPDLRILCAASCFARSP